MRAALARADRALLVTLRTRGHSPTLERAARRYSRLGEHGAAWYGVGIAGAALSSLRTACSPAHRPAAERGPWIRGIAVTGVAYGLNYAIKLAARRPRPALDGLPPLSPVVSRLSFPSAHATTSFAAAAAYRRAMPAGAPALYGAAGMIALSRPYLGVHYPSDVIAGAALGTLIEAVWPR